MPLPNLGRTIKGRAGTQASANIESSQAVVSRIYADSQGNVFAADVTVKGQVHPLVQVSNVSGEKLYAGATVEVRYSKGNRHSRQIVGSSSGNTASALSQSTVNAPVDPNIAAYVGTDGPVILQSASTVSFPSGYVEVPGANVFLTDTPPGTTSGGAVNGQRQISAQPLVMTSLPSPLTTTLPGGTVLDLMDSYGNSLGMWRLDVAAKVWRRRDVGGGSGGGGTTSTTSGFTPAAPVPPSNIFLISNLYSGTAMALTFGAAFYTSDPAASSQICQWQKSVDAGVTWTGNDGTSATVYPGGNLFPIGLTSGTIRARCRTENALGAFSAWVAITTDVTYTAPSAAFAPGSVQAPASVTFDHADYSGTTELITWRAKNTAAYTAGAIEFYGWQTSPDNTTWTTEVFGGDTYQGLGITSGNQYARARAYPLVTTGGTATPSGWVSSSVQAYAPPNKTFCIYIPGALVAGADAEEVTLPSYFSSSVLKRLGARVGGASTSGSVTFTAQLSTATGSFSAAQTSDTITIPVSTNEISDVTSFTSGLTGSAGNKVRINITAAGTGARDLVVRFEFAAGQ